MENNFSIKTGKFTNRFLKRVFCSSGRHYMVFVFLLLNTASYAFGQKVTVNFNNVTISQALSQLSTKTGVDFFYSDLELDTNRKVSGTYNNTDLKDVVSELVGEGYEIREESEGLYLIIPLKKAAQEYTLVQGQVTDKLGGPLPGVTVRVKDEPIGTSTDVEGRFKIKVPEESILTFSYIGFKTLELDPDGQEQLTIQLEEEVSELDEVVLIGIVERKKESFTGATNTITAEEIKTIGNQNVLESIKTLDPSFVIADNTLQGSNPNVLPNIEIRGKTSASTATVRDEFTGDPNQPLFVLDGFETDLRTIVDLDMNRVASITILKDASSTALYGSRAANGVVVVETIRPKAEKLNVTYTNDFQIETPDLSVYNLMNAEEKLEFERLSGRFDFYDQYSPIFQEEQDSVYNQLLAEVKRGVDTYWLSEPVKTAYSQRHSVYINGGSEQGFRIGAGVSYRQGEGVMKGSFRNTWQGNLDVTYRNKGLNISNQLFLNGVHSEESPYESFRLYAQANPYFRKYNEFGGVNKYLDNNPTVAGLTQFYNVNGANVQFRVVNPLYNATLPNRYDNTDVLKIQNNLRFTYDFSNALRLQAGLQLVKSTSTREAFLPPEHSSFDGLGYELRGTYNNNESDEFSYRGNLMLTYARVFNNLHSLTVNARAEVEESEFASYGTRVVGFPSGTNGNPGFSFGYPSNGGPSSASRVFRRNNLLASTNYAFDGRYFIDLTYRLDGSTAFGSNERYSPFWSAGLGWNLHRDLGFNPDLVSLLKVRASVGSLGNQRFGNVASTSVYSYGSQVNIFGQGITLETLGNPDLEWQNTLSSNLGLDFTMFGNRFSGSVEAYRKYTDPLVIQVGLPASTGVNAYPLNAGHLETTGLEAILRVSPIYKPAENTIWTLTLNASSLESEYGGLGNTLEEINEEQVENNSLERFRDGYSPNDIWAVPSLGIDPATGREVFLKKNGQTTFAYDPNDAIVVGSLQPDFQGVVGTQLSLKGLLVGVNLRFRLGGEIFNSALYEKVENISASNIYYNQDRRALYDRWQEPGDIAKYKGISLTESTPISSRFVQEQNELIGESINLGYRFTKESWIQYMGLNTLNVNMYLNDIFRWASVEAERGIDYPFARTFSFSINASF